jgi:hypothetical protein
VAFHLLPVQAVAIERPGHQMHRLKRLRLRRLASETHQTAIAKQLVLPVPAERQTAAKVHISVGDPGTAEGAVCERAEAPEGPMQNRAGEEPQVPQQDAVQVQTARREARAEQPAPGE